MKDIVSSRRQFLSRFLIGFATPVIFARLAEAAGLDEGRLVGKTGKPWIDLSPDGLYRAYNAAKKIEQCQSDYDEKKINLDTANQAVGADAADTVSKATTSADDAKAALDAAKSEYNDVVAKMKQVIVAPNTRCALLDRKTLAGDHYGDPEHEVKIAKVKITEGPSKGKIGWTQFYSARYPVLGETAYPTLPIVGAFEISDLAALEKFSENNDKVRLRKLYATEHFVSIPDDTKGRVREIREPFALVDFNDGKESYSCWVSRIDLTVFTPGKPNKGRIVTIKKEPEFGSPIFGSLSDW